MATQFLGNDERISAKKELITWVATIAPLVFTSHMAFVAVAMLLGIDYQSEFSDAHASGVGEALKLLADTGFLSHPKSAKTYSITQRPPKKLVEHIGIPRLPVAAEQPVTAKAPPAIRRWQDIARDERLMMFDWVLDAFLQITRGNNTYKALGGGVFEGSYQELFDRASSGALKKRVHPREIHIELAEARAFGLYWFADQDMKTFRWRSCTVLLLQRYVGQNEVQRLRNKIMTMSRTGRDEHVQDKSE